MEIQLTEVSEIGNDEIILDIGKNTINSIKKLINRSRTIFGMDQQDITRIKNF